jgi:anti-sigma-K factor RskA
MTCDEFEELSGAYALDAVTPAERQAAQAHLATCAKCSRLVQELSAAASVLPLTAPQVSPSPELKEQVMQAIRATQQEPGRRIPFPPRPPLRPPRHPAARRAGWATPLLVAAIALLLLAVGGMTTWNFSLRASNAQLSSQISQLQHTNAAQSSQITSLSHEIARVYGISGTLSAQAATGMLLYLPQQNITVLVLHNLPRLQGTQIYQGWLVHNKTPISIGVLSVQNGVASLVFPGVISGYDAAAVSQEPGPGPSAHAPAGPVVAAASLQHSALVEFTIW